MNARFVEWIWHIKGSLPLLPGQSSDEAFDQLDPLFHERGTSHERTGDTLTFRKENQAPQSRMSIFDGGVLWIDNDAAGPVLRYHLISRALLYCFLAPLLFLAFAGISIGLGRIDRPTPQELAAEKKKAEEEEKKAAAWQLNPVDEFLGAPAPEKPKKDEKADEEPKSKHSPTAAYVFAAIFAVLYVVGRILEAWLVKRLFRRRLLGS